MSTEQQASPAATSIHPGTNIGLVTLRVADLERSRRFYEGILAFQPIEQEPGKVVLGGQDKQPLLELIEVPGAAPQPRRATGLYHVAILFPTRPDLGRELLRVANAGIQIGQGDHLVSEALYISDPDDNGLELYRDRPRDTWHWTNGMVEMATDPVDIRGRVEAGQRGFGWRAWTVRECACNDELAILLQGGIGRESHMESGSHAKGVHCITRILRSVCKQPHRTAVHGAASRRSTASHY